MAAIPPAQAWGSISWENLQVHFWELPDSSKATFPSFCFCGHSLSEYLSGGHWSGSGVHLINTERASHLKMSNLVGPTKSLLCVNIFHVMGIMASVIFVVSEKGFFFPLWDLWLLWFFRICNLSGFCWLYGFWRLFGHYRLCRFCGFYGNCGLSGLFRLCGFCGSSNLLGFMGTAVCVVSVAPVVSVVL